MNILPITINILFILNNLKLFSPILLITFFLYILIICLLFIFIKS